MNRQTGIKNFEKTTTGNNWLKKIGLLLSWVLLTQALQAQYLISNNCNTNRGIEVLMKGVKNSTNPSINVGNISTTSELLVTVWVADNNCGSNSLPTFLTITNGSQSIAAPATIVTQTSASQVAERLFRATINHPDNQIVSVAGLNGCFSTSISVQKVVSAAGGASFVREVNKEFHFYQETFTLDIGTATQTRDVKVSVPIHEKDNDGKIAKVEVAGTGITTVSQQITMQTNGDAAGLVEVNIPNVPASTTQLDVTIISPTTNGASFGIGAITVNTTTFCAPPTVEIEGKPNDESWINTDTLRVCENSKVELQALPDDNSGSWSWTGPNGFTANTRYFVLSNSITTNFSGKYTVRYTDANGATTTDNIVLVVRNEPSFISIVAQDELCEYENGSILFSFNLEPDETTMEISLDGGLTFLDTLNVDGNASSTTLGVPDPFPCQSGFYQIINTSGANGQLYIFDINTNTYVAVGNPPGIPLNAAGYNPVDGFLYVMAQSGGTDALGQSVQRGDVLKMDADGEVFKMAFIKGTTYNAGYIENGNMWVTAGRAIVKFSLSTFAIDFSVNVPNSIAIGADIVILNGTLYTIKNGTNRLVVIDANSLAPGQTLVSNTYTIANLPSDAFGAFWVATNGITGEKEIYVSANSTGSIYRIDDFTTSVPTATLVATGTPTGSNDGTSCPNAEAGVFFGQSSYSINNLSSGTYDLVARWGDDSCLVDLPDVTVGQIPGPTALVGIDQTICEGESAMISVSNNTGTPPFYYAWDNNLGTSTTVSVSPEPTAVPSETFTFNAVVTDGNGCQDTAGVNITVRNTPDLQIFSVQPDCTNPQGGFLSIIPQAGFNNLQFSITNEPSFSSVAQYPNLGVGQYPIRVLTEDNCLADYVNNPLIMDLPNVCTEICNDGIDNDGDGDIDCDDSDCSVGSSNIVIDGN